jgi:hypothetical protein
MKPAVKRTLGLLILGIAWCAALPAAAPTCRPSTPVPLRVRFAGEAPRQALIQSIWPTGLRLIDPVTGALLWSAGPDASSTQQISAMDASFGSSLTAIDLNADGVHDRLYAGDRAGRLWRLDLRASARPAQWMQASVLADLRAPGVGRGFIAAPDVTLLTAGRTSWLNIAIGTANTGPPRNDHRFYVLRDGSASAPSTPMTEADLAALSAPAGAIELAPGAAPARTLHGYYLPLGSAQVLAQSLTLDGKTWFTAVENAGSFSTACATDELSTAPVPLSVTVLRAADGAVLAAEVAAHTPGAPPVLLRQPLGMWPAMAGVELAPVADQNGRIACVVGTQPLPGCFLDTRPRRTWWRREDAD